MDNITKPKTAHLEQLRLYRLPTRVLKHIQQNPFTRDFPITEIGYHPSNAIPFTKAHEASRQHVLLFLSSGSINLRIDKRKTQLARNQAALIPVGSNYEYGSNSDIPINLFWIKFKNAGSKDLLSWTAFSKTNPVISCTAPENTKRHFNAILNAVERGYTEHTTLQLSLALIKILISLHENPLDRENKGSLNRIEATMNRMREDVSKPQSLKTYAEQTGYSVTQFSHLFRQHTGTSPINYLNELRMQRAAEYLNNTDWSIKRIAYELGFEDPLYFSRNFRKCVGISPKAYRSR